MIRYIPVFPAPGGRLSFVPRDKGNPVALVAVSCRWETRPVVDDESGRLRLPGKGGEFSAWGFLEAARHRHFRFRIRWQQSAPRRVRNRRRRKAGAA